MAVLPIATVVVPVPVDGHQAANVPPLQQFHEMITEIMRWDGKNVEWLLYVFTSIEQLVNTYPELRNDERRMEFISKAKEAKRLHGDAWILEIADAFGKSLRCFRFATAIGLPAMPTIGGFRNFMARARAIPSAPPLDPVTKE